MKNKEKIAVFIDADNAPAGKIDTVLSELARYGVVNIRKAYGNWKNHNLKPWEDANSTPKCNTRQIKQPVVVHQTRSAV
ncbi:NYN domain-containing protein, partial [Aeromonas veronii]